MNLYRWSRILWGALAAALAMGPACALDPARAVTQYALDAWQTRDGLPQSSITALLQTRDGYLWLGTEEGLVRFDGVNFTVFNRDNTPAFAHSHVWTLYEDRAGVLWIGTVGGGLIRHAGGRFQAYGATEGLASPVVLAVREDAGGTLWAGTQDAGLFRLRGERFEPLANDGELTDKLVTCLAAGRDGGLWIGTPKGLNRLRDGRLNRFTAAEGLSGANVRALAVDSAGDLWIGTWGGGLIRHRAGTFTPFTTREGLAHDSVMAILPDRDGNLWIGTRGGGLSRYQHGSFATLSPANGLADGVVWALAEDREGSLWIGTLSGGLNRLKNGKLTGYGTAEGLPHNNVVSVWADADDSLWAGTFGGGLARFAGGQFTGYTTADGLSSNLVTAFCRDAAGDLWVGTADGLNRMRGGRFTPFTVAEGLAHRVVWALSADPDGSVWIGTGNGLNRYRGGRFERFGEAEGLATANIRALLPARGGGLWIGTWGGGLYRFRDGRFSAWTTAQGLSSDFVFTLHEDERGVLWIGTNDQGLNRFEGGRFTPCTTREGLYDNRVFKILDDGRGRLWMSCNKGIFAVPRAELDELAAGRRKTVRCTAFTESDGMKSQECNGGCQAAGAATRDGRLWFPTILGLAVVDPAHLPVNRQPPPVTIERFLVDGREIDSSRPVVLPPGQDKFEVHYAGLSFYAPERVRFRYRLENQETAWTDPGSRRVAYYTNLPPGEYRFQVVACNNDGVWNREGAALRFVLEPRFYQTGWFYALCGLAVVAGGLGLHSRRISRLKRRTAELNGLVQERTAELTAANRQLGELNQQLDDANRELHRLADLDGLTGLSNRRYFEETLDREWKRCIRNASPLSLIMIDVDCFKAYNDHFGHLAGDDCLRRLVAELAGALKRPFDLAARYGGEEFVVLLPETDAFGAFQVAEGIRRQAEALAIPHPASTVAPHVTISLGVATDQPILDSSPQPLLGEADRALYEAKQAGRNRTHAAG